MTSTMRVKRICIDLVHIVCIILCTVDRYVMDDRLCVQTRFVGELSIVDKTLKRVGGNRGVHRCRLPHMVMSALVFPLVANTKWMLHWKTTNTARSSIDDAETEDCMIIDVRNVLRHDRGFDALLLLFLACRLVTFSVCLTNPPLDPECRLLHERISSRLALAAADGCS